MTRRGGKVALVILALLSLISYRALDSSLRARAQTAMEADRWREIGYFFERLQDDVEQVAPRGPRLSNGAVLPAWSGGGDTLVIAVLGGGSAPLRRVKYGFVAGVVELRLWPAFDGPDASAGERYGLVHGVRDVRYSFLNRVPTWVASWPAGLGEAGLPLALRVDLTMDDGVAIRRVFALP